MAEVWEGRDEVLDRPIAVKILLAHLADDVTLQERFRREAVTAARLVHPGIVAVFDAGIELLDGQARGWPRGGAPEASTAFMVMELVKGETLRDLIARAAPLPAPVAVAITSQVASALGYAHSQGLVHRDIKPANVLLSDEGPNLRRVKVTDFGIAKATAAAGADLTAAGTIVGTPKYLSPEQVEGLEPDARADLYSLGLVLFEMLTGKPPFLKGTDMATALARVQEPVPKLEEFRSDLPVELGQLLGELLAREPARRVPSAAALRDSLGALGSHWVAAPTSPEVGAYLGLAGLAAPGAGEGARSWQQPRRSPVQEATLPDNGSVGVAESATGLLTDGEKSGPGLGGDGTVTAGTPGLVLEDQEVAPREGGPGWTGPEEAAGGAPDHPPAHPPERSERPRRRADRTITVAVALLLAAGSLAASGLVRGAGPGEKPGTGATTQGRGAPGATTHPPIGIREVSELTQGGNKPNDHLAELRYLTDGNPKTAWESDIYNGPAFGGWGGFGLVMKLGGEHLLHLLSVQTPMQGWSAEVFVRSSCASSLELWGRAVEVRSGLRGDATFALDGQRGACVLLWMLDPGPKRQAVVQELSLS